MSAIAGGTVGIALLLAASGAGQQGGPSVDVSLKLERDGLLSVTERVVVPPGANLTRTVPLRLPAGDESERVFTVRDPLVDGNGNAAVTDDTLSLTLGPGESTVHYTVDGAVATTGTAEQVRWRAADGWDAELAEVTASFSAPTPQMSVTGCLAGPPGSTSACTLAGVDHTGIVRAEHAGLAAGERVELTVDVPAGLVPANARFDTVTTFAGAFALTPVAGAALVVLAVLLAAAAAALWLARRRDAAASTADPAPVEVLITEGDRVVFASPDGVLPGHIGTVVDETVDPVDIAATVIDLAVRNYLWITEVPGDDGTEWQLSRRNPPDEALHGFERAVLDALLPADRDTGTLGELRGALDLMPVRDAMYADVVGQGWFTGRALTGRGPLTWLGAGLAVAGAGLTFALAFTVGHALAGVAVLLAGLALTYGANLLPRRTARGRSLAGQVRGLLRYLHEVRAEDVPAADRELVFSRALPYAVVLGDTERWLRVFRDLDPEANGASGVYWFGGFEGERDLSRFASHFPRFVTALEGLLAEAAHLRSIRTATPAG